MSSDASAAAASPMTNGTSLTGGHREADASTSPATTTSRPSTTLADVCADLNRRVTNFLDAPPTTDLIRRTQEQTRISIGVIEKALQDYDFKNLSLSYNGGKDCLVLLIIYLSTLHTHFTRTKQPPPPPSTSASSNTTKTHNHATTPTFPPSIPSIYAKPPDPFPAVTSFVDTSSAQYHLSLTHISTNPGTLPNAKSHSSPPLPSATSSKTITFRDAFALYLAQNPHITAIFVGTRRTDPHGSRLTHFDLTDGAWPRFMRIHPVIDWHLSEIWTFLRSPQLADPESGRDTLEYCTMYDEGYTSLGGVEDTLRNPKLRYVDETGVERYKPAYTLTEDDEERLGRE